MRNLVNRIYNRRRCLSVLIYLILWGLYLSATARAQKTDAEQLFEQGRALLKLGKVTEACDRFLKSAELELSAGTFLNLGACQAVLGKIASARDAYAVAHGIALEQNRPELAEEAKRQVAALDDYLSFLTIVVKEVVPGLIVSRDQTEIPHSLYNRIVAVDPQQYQIRARAKGYLPWSKTVTVQSEGDHKVVVVPKLTKIEESKAPVPIESIEVEQPAPVSESQQQEAILYKRQAVKRSSAPERKSLKTKREPEQILTFLPWISGGVGAASLIAGAIFGGLAIQNNDQAEERCPTRKNCDGTTIAIRNKAEDYALVSDITLVTGIAGIAAGVVLFIVIPSGDALSDNPLVQVSAVGQSTGLRMAINF